MQVLIYLIYLKFYISLKVLTGVLSLLLCSIFCSVKMYCI